MAIALVGSAAVPAGNPTTSFTVTIPSAVAANDLLFLAVTSRDSTGAGSLSVTDNDTGGNTWTKIGNSTDHKATLWYKRATSGSASKTVTVSNAVGSASGVLKAFSGGDAGATPYTNVVVETNAGADETHAGFTPSNNDSMVCCSVHNYANDNAVTSLSFATLGATTATEKLSTGGLDCGCIFGHALQTGTAAATGNLTWAQTDGTTYSITWAIKPIAAYTLTAAQGSFTETGNAASTLFGHKTIGDAGAFTLTGNNATLTHQAVGYTLTAAAGSFAETGNAASLLRGYPLTASPGTFTETGVATGLLAGRLLSSAQGSFSETGNNAGLSKSFPLTAASGAFVESGVAASFGRTYVVAGAQGALSETGNSANLLFGHLLTGGAGSIAETGNSANLGKGRTLTASSGSVAETGTPSSLLVTRLMTGAAGSHSFSGVNAGVLCARTVSGALGTIALTGNSATLQPGIASDGYTLDAWCRHFKVQEFDARLTHHRPYRQGRKRAGRRIKSLRNLF